MKRLIAALVAWLSRSLPSDEQLEADTPDLRDFHNRVEQTRGSRRAS